MKKSLLLAFAFAAVCGYVMAETPAPAQEEATQVPQEETTQPAPQQEDESLDMDAMLDDETEEAK